ncbi:MAG: type II secretion system protein [Steroidobacter sp.]
MSKFTPRSAQGGFTLIELVVVIVILGILAAFAVPRFARLDAQARASSVRSLEGSLRSATTMTHGLWLAAGNNPGTVAVEGGVNVAMNVAGFPTAAANGVRVALDPGTYSPALAGNGAIAGRFVTAVNGAAMEFRIVGAPNGSNGCMVSYTPPAAVNGLPVWATNVAAC